MKKIIITITLLLGTVFIYAQKAEFVRQIKEFTDSSEDPHNPLVNGIPYSQYKAEVQAEQKQKAAAEAKAIADQKTVIENRKSNLKLQDENQIKNKAKN